MTKPEILSILSNHLDAETVQQIATDLPSEDDEREARDAIRFEGAAHGYDLENGRTYDPDLGISVYDLDPGVTYNDGGEPIGYC